MAYIVKSYKVKFQGKVFEKGQKIDNLPKSEKERLIRLGFIEKLADEVFEEADDNFKDITDMTVPEGQQYIQTIEDIKLLEQMLVEEGNHKDRRGIIEAIKDRIQELQI